MKLAAYTDPGLVRETASHWQRPSSDYRVRLKLKLPRLKTGGFSLPPDYRVRLKLKLPRLNTGLSRCPAWGRRSITGGSAAKRGLREAPPAGPAASSASMLEWDDII
jgi:hypothetical protein